MKVDADTETKLEIQGFVFEKLRKMQTSLNSPHV